MSSPFRNSIYRTLYDCVIKLLKLFNFPGYFSSFITFSTFNKILYSIKMSIKLVCKPEFFESRLNSHLGLNVTTEPGTTYFLCNDIEEVPSLVDPASLTFLSGEKKVTINENVWFLINYKIL
jgi:hypothetical protein